PFQLNLEKEALYQLYRANFQGYIARSLVESLLEEEDYNIYNTVEAQIYDGDTLVGLSFFDVGEDAVSSILGIYHPRYQQYSLGYYTMLLEMEYCRRQQIRYYYPGYVVPGYTRFDYKLRIGAVDYLSLAEGGWLPYADLTPTDVPLVAMRKRLVALKSLLDRQGIPNQPFDYPLFETNLFGFFDEHHYLEHPSLLALFPQANQHQIKYFVVFDLQIQEYLVLHCESNDDFRFFLNENYLNTFDHSRFLLDLKAVKEILFHHADVQTVAQWIQRQFGG
ncbi:MAG: arginine-tRNA-protein transferase, partial [Bacteroidota bacterium]